MSYHAVYCPRDNTYYAGDGNWTANEFYAARYSGEGIAKQASDALNSRNYCGRQCRVVFISTNESSITDKVLKMEFTSFSSIVSDYMLPSAEEASPLKLLDSLRSLDLNFQPLERYDSKLENPSALLEQDFGFYIPYDVFYSSPGQRVTLTVKNNAPVPTGSTEPSIRITKVSCTWNYVDAFGNATRSTTTDIAFNTPPGQSAVIYSDSGLCARTFTFQVTVGIPELNAYKQLSPIFAPDYQGCYIAVSGGVGV
jgi:hypothetical protein